VLAGLRVDRAMDAESVENSGRQCAAAGVVSHDMAGIEGSCIGHRFDGTVAANTQLL
jgi:hypothetical protein